MADVTVSVKHGKHVHTLTLAPTTTLANLRAQLHMYAHPTPPQPSCASLTDVAPASQKLMGKGTLRPEDDGACMDVCAC